MTQPIIKFCTKCVMSNQRPRITFDRNGVCSACVYAEKKKKFDWTAREYELKLLCDKHRRKDGRFDVVVPVSGGKDGCYVAHQLKHVYGMNPLTVTWAPNAPTEIGQQNLQAFIDSGFTNIYGRPNGQVNRKLVRVAFETLGDPFQPFIYGQTNFPLRVALDMDIPLIMYGENGEVEYGGDMRNAMSPTRKVTDHAKHYFSGIPPEKMERHGFTKQDLHPYTAPPDNMLEGIEIHFFGYYKYWDPQENFYYCQKHTGFKPNPQRSEGTYSKYASLDDRLDSFHYHLGFLKYGIGRATSDAAHEIRDGKITREEGVALVKKYDAEKPSREFNFFLDYCGLTEEGYAAVLRLFRSPHVWERSGNEQDGNEWKLKRSVWD